jgi:hypothetical protein
LMFDVMRTTLTLDDDVLDAARRLSDARGVSIGAVVSDLARRGLAAATSSAEPARSRNGIRLFPVGTDSSPVTPEHIAQLLADSE